MLLFWRIRYFDNRDRQFKDRDLFLVTEDIDALARAAVEASEELRQVQGARVMLKHRHLFKLVSDSPAAHAQAQAKCDRFSSFCVPDYFEDENGLEIPRAKLAAVMTGSPSAITIPPGAKQHDIDYILAPKQPICIDKITLSQEQLQVLGYFSRDLQEISRSAFFNEGPGSLSGFGTVGGLGSGDLTLKTAATDEEIRSFVTIFRRLYMKDEPANFPKAMTIFGSSFGDHPLGVWVKSAVREYVADLERPPGHAGFYQQPQITFSRKRLIDVHLYTQYAHQPDARRLSQYQECLRAVGGRRPLLTHLFLTELWTCSLTLWNVGQRIPPFLDAYCHCHGASCDVIASPAVAHPGIGELEKKREFERRVLQERAESLAVSLWEEAGRPAGGHLPFVAIAMAALTQAIGEHGGSPTERQ